MENKLRNNSSMNVDLKEVIKIYTNQRKWFIVCVIIAISLAYLVIRYSVPEYAANAKIQILVDTNSSAELSAFTDLGILGAGGGQNTIDDEIEILNSRSNFIEVVRKLKINLKVTALGNVKNTELYQNRPFNINFISNDSIISSSMFEFFIQLRSDSDFGFGLERDSPIETYSFGNSIPTEIGEIIITPNIPFFSKYKGQQLKVSINPVTLVAEYYRDKMIISPATEYSNIIDISLNDEIKEKAIDIINELVGTYNAHAIEDKKNIADRTSEFINNRIDLISGTLATVDKEAQDLLTEKGITAGGLEVGAAIQVSTASRQQLESARVQLQMVTGMKDYVNQEIGYEEMPVVDIGNVAVSETTTRYNQLVAERKRLLKSADEKNPMIVSLDGQLDVLKSTMRSSLVQMERNVGMNVGTLQNQMGRIQGTIYQAPKNQRDLRNITRKQETTEALYLYLLQKREESQISAASSPEKSRIVDSAYQVGNEPVAPNPPVVYLASIILGLLVPFSIIFVKDLLNNKIQNKIGLEKLVHDVPVLAELPKLSKKDNNLIAKDDRSVLAESLRILRTNLDYLIKSKKSNGKGNIIFVTSSVPGEGKTFLSSNLSMIFANTSKKVLLIGADIRNPKLYNFFINKNVDKLGKSTRSKDAGLTEFLYDESYSAKDIINPMLVHTNTIDVIYSGKIPPNPSELLMSNRMEELLMEVSLMYDYVIVDTAPVMVVTDTLLISKYADHILYVTRAGATENKIIDFPMKLRSEGKLKGLSFVVNGVKDTDLGYGGKYGYGYGKTTKKWWKF